MVLKEPGIKIAISFPLQKKSYISFVCIFRLLRFEEKNVLRQEIEQLHEKVDQEESRTSKLEDQLKIFQTEKLLQTQKLSDLTKEQEIGGCFFFNKNIIGNF